jgi:bifunctional DNA-binding transcriptional regulator/antitoxin component of YhaV-PrlF toxin-antitoxin module
MLELKDKKFTIIDQLMKSKTIVKVTQERQFSFPPELQSQLQPGDEYRAIFQGKSIILEKVAEANLDVDKFLDELEQLEPDPNQATLEEISKIVKDVRGELWSK